MTGERGSASVLVVVAATVALVFGVAATLLATALGSAARARTAADLAALAAADVQAAAGDACAAAERVARANAAGLVTCDPGGAAVTVVVEVPSVLGRAVRARARAEPGGWERPGRRTLNSELREPDS